MLLSSDDEINTDSDSFCDICSIDSDDYNDLDPIDVEQEISNENPEWFANPCSLCYASALRVLQTVNVQQLRRDTIPISLYPVLLSQAFRMPSADIVSHLVSTWPYSVLDFNKLDACTINCMFTKDCGKGLTSLASMVIQGLLNVKQECKLKKVVLPDSECEGTKMTQLFCRLPLYALEDEPRQELTQMITDKVPYAFDVDLYLEQLSFSCYPVNIQRKEPIVIMLPGVIQAKGKHKNYYDVLVGLALQTRFPFRFAMEKLVLLNVVDLNQISALLQMVSVPEHTKKISIKHQPISEIKALHSILKLGILHTVFKRFTAVKSLSAKFHGHNSRGTIHDGNDQIVGLCASVFSSWSHLTEINLSKNILRGTLCRLLKGLNSRLLKLYLAETGLNESDIKFLASSPHTQTLQYLNVSRNNLHFPYMKYLLSNMKALVCLKMESMGITLTQALTFAESLSHLDSLRLWSVQGNELRTVAEVLQFIEVAGRMGGIEELQCKSQYYDLHSRPNFLDTSAASSKYNITIL